MDEAARGQVNASAAEVYERFFVPALFGQWAEQLVQRAHLSSGQRVLDVACGTGVVARAAAPRVAPSGAVVGLDANPGMLRVAAAQAPSIDWREGRVEDLAYPAGSFDAVFCQFGLMFFEDRQQAISEMLRVLTPGGHLIVAVWGALETSPGYAAVVELLERLFGSVPADALRAPFCLGDTDVLRGEFAKADVNTVQLETLSGRARFASVDAWMHTDVKGWTLADLIDDDQFETLCREAQPALSTYVGRDGRVEFAAPAHVVTVSKDRPR